MRINIFQDSGGFVLPFAAMVLMTWFLVGGIIIDAGNLYIRHGELQHLAKQSANTGIITFSQALQEVANANKTAICYGGEEPPEVCISENIFDFLSAEEILVSVSSASVQQQVIGASKDFSKIYDRLGLISDENIQVIFPADFSGIEEIQIRVKIVVIWNQFFSGILGNGEIEVEAVSFMKVGG